MKKIKRFFFGSVVFILVVCMIELSCFCLLNILYGPQAGDVCGKDTAKQEAVLPPWLTKNSGTYIIHPYLGFVYNPQELDITDFGFLGKTDPLQKKSKDKFIIGIFGGSSAEILAQYGSKKLIEQLKKNHYFKDKKIIVLNLAIGSYKQPQQLMAFNYLLALGGEFDIVVDFDGFNEIVIPQLRNMPNSVNPFFPMRWDLKVVDKDILNPELSLLAQIIRLKEKEDRINDTVCRSWLRFSNTAKLVALRLNKIIDFEMSKKRIELFKLRGTKMAAAKNIISCGPEFEYKDENDLYDKLAKLWLDCSVMMSDLCKERGIEYLHFLQPCQYLPGSKEMDEEELKQAFDPDALHRDMVVKGYPVLLEKSEVLLSKDIGFYDFSRVFAGHEEPLYIDTFCHFGQKGSEIIAKKIAQVILKSRSQH